MRNILFCAQDSEPLDSLAKSTEKVWLLVLKHNDN